MPDPITPLANTVPFNLDGMAELLKETNPQLAKEVNVEEFTQTPTEPVEQAPAEPVEQTPPEPVEQAPDDQEQPETEPSEDKSLEDELAELNRQSTEAKTKPAAPKTEAPLAQETAKPAELQQRDEDLKLDTRQSAAMHPKTKKIIEERNQKIIAERNKADALAKEKEELAAELNRAREAAKKGTLPKETEEELTKLRERIREIDIAKDPALETKYDKPISENQNKIVAILQEFGLGKTTDGKDDPEALAALKKSGLTFNALAPHIKKLSEEGYEDSAEELREILRENIRLGRAKEKEISEWRVDFDAKKQQAQQFSQQQQEKIAAETREHATRHLNNDVAVLSKDFPFLNRPSEPLPTDSAAVTKAKQDAIAAYDAATKSITEAIGQLDPAKVTPDKVSEVNGRITANAVQAIILKQHVLPRLMKDLAELKSRNTELETKVGKIKTAGNLSRAHAAAATSPAGAKAPLPENTEDAAKQIAREMGLQID